VDGQGERRSRGSDLEAVALVLLKLDVAEGHRDHHEDEKGEPAVVFH
jgi:hypothetical protein